MDRRQLKSVHDAGLVRRRIPAVTFPFARYHCPVLRGTRVKTIFAGVTASSNASSRTSSGASGQLPRIDSNTRSLSGAGGRPKRLA